MQTHPNERGAVNQPEKIEQAIKVCAALFQQALSLSIPLRFATNASTQEEDRSMMFSPEYSSQEGGMELLRLLARLRVRSTQHISALFQQLEQQSWESSDLILVTAYLDQEMMDFAGRMAADRGVRLRALVLDHDKGQDWGPDMEAYYLSEEKSVQEKGGAA